LAFITLLTMVRDSKTNYRVVQKTAQSLCHHYFILGAHASAQKQQTRATVVISHKVTRVTLHHFHYSMCLKCPPAARTQAVDVDATRQQHVQ